MYEYGGGGGSADAPWPSIYALTKPPSVSTLTWVNQGTASAVDDTYGLHLSTPASAVAQIMCLVKTIPTAPYTATLGMLANVPPVTNPECGFVLRNSGTGACVTLGLGWINNFILNNQHWTNATTFSTSNVNTNYSPMGAITFLRLRDDGTNRIFLTSTDGANFVQWTSYSRTLFTTPDQIGFFVSSNSGTAGVDMRLVHYLEGP